MAKFSSKDQRLTAFSTDARIYTSDSVAVELLGYMKKYGQTMPRFYYNTSTI